MYGIGIQITIKNIFKKKIKEREREERGINSIQTSVKNKEKSQKITIYFTEMNSRSHYFSSEGIKIIILEFTRVKHRQGLLYDMEGKLDFNEKNELEAYLLFFNCRTKTDFDWSLG